MAQLESIASLYLCPASFPGFHHLLILCYKHCASRESGNKATCVYCDLHQASSLQKHSDSTTLLTHSLDIYYFSPDNIVSWPTENHSYEVHLWAYVLKLKTVSACIVFKLLVHALSNQPMCEGPCLYLRLQLLPRAWCTLCTNDMQQKLGRAWKQWLLRVIGSKKKTVRTKLP